jgi:methyl-accepting chemotaxis protein
METINEEMQGLGAAYQRGGLPLLVRTVERRSRQPGANLYLIADPAGRVLSGNVEGLDPEVLAIQGWTEQPFRYLRFGDVSTERRDADTARSEPMHEAIALVLRLPNQMIVLVGRDLGEPERFRTVVRRALVAALGAMGLGALLIWYFVGRRALKHIDKVSAASRRIMGGDLSGRLPVTGAGDEFDRLSENLNTMLARTPLDGAHQKRQAAALIGSSEALHLLIDGFHGLRLQHVG